MADVVLVVAPEARHHGLGVRLGREMLVEAVERNYRKVTVTIPTDNVGKLERPSVQLPPWNVAKARMRRQWLKLDGSQPDGA